jgi:hypothetical protein
MYNLAVLASAAGAGSGAGGDPLAEMEWRWSSAREMKASMEASWWRSKSSAWWGYGGRGARGWGSPGDDGARGWGSGDDARGWGCGGVAGRGGAGGGEAAEALSPGQLRRLWALSGPQQVDGPPRKRVLRIGKLKIVPHWSLNCAHTCL